MLEKNWRNSAEKHNIYINDRQASAVDSQVRHYNSQDFRHGGNLSVALAGLEFGIAPHGSQGC